MKHDSKTRYEAIRTIRDGADLPGEPNLFIHLYM